MTIVGRIAREPLAHFLAAGVALFAVFSLMGGGEAPQDDTTIEVDRRALLAYMQYRANAFEPEAFGAVLDAMTGEELQALIDDYADEEALYREAKALGLEASDYIIRQRMVDKMRFLLGDMAIAGETPDEGALADYFAANRQAYAVEASLTFTHIFFNAERRGEAEAEQAARAALARLNGAGATFNDAPGEGDRFPFLQNYVERTPAFVASHFGEGFALALDAMQPADAWQGPVRSAYGWHAVLVTGHAPARLPALAEVRERVAEDYQREQADAAFARMTAELRGRYDVRVGQIGADARAAGDIE